MLTDKYVEILRNCKDQHRLVALFTTEQDMTIFSVGFVKYIGENEFRLNRVTEYGCFDGIYVATFDVIQRIDWDSRYLKRISLLLGNRSSFRRKTVGREKTLSGGGLRAELEISKRYHYLVTVEIRTSTECEGSRLYAFVDEIRDEYAILSIVSSEGEPDGMSIVPVTSIRRLSRGDEETRAVTRLYQQYTTVAT